MGAALILLAAVLAYANSFSGAFVFDDQTAIVSNPAIRTLSLPSAATDSPRNTTLAGRPLAAVTFALNYAGGSLDTFGYHATNLLIHVLAALLLYAVARRALDAAGHRVKRPLPSNVLALAIALLWTVHPLTTSSVTYIVQRVESLMSLMYLLTVYCGIRSVTEDRRLWIVGAAVACVAGMATKESMVTAPVMVVFWDLLFIEGSRRTILARRWRLYAALCASWILLAWIMSTAPRSASVGFGLQGVSAWSYLLTQAQVIVHYLKLALVPWPLSVDYEWPVATSVGQVLPQAALVLALVLVTLWGFWRRAPWSFAGVWFFGILGPTSSIIPIVTEVAAEHRMYLPLAAVIASGVLLVWRAIEAAALSSRVAFQRAGFALSIVAVVLLVRTTRERNDDYQSAERLYRFTVSHQPHNARALNNLATLMIERREPGEAESYLRRALAVRPGYAEAQSNLGISVAMQGRAEEAIPLFAEAVRLEPDLSFAWRNYGEGLASLGRFHEALAAYRKALAANQDDIMSLERISWIQSTAPQAEIRDGAEAVRLALRATELTGKRDARALDVLAAALAETGNFVEATSTAERALTLARSAGQSELSSDIEYRIQVYRRGAPYREIPAQLPTPNSQLPKSPSR